MLSFFKKSILLSILILSFTSCAAKSEGKYHTKYSYHPYYSLYAKKMFNTQTKRKKISSKKTNSKSEPSLDKKNRFPNYSSK